MARVLFDGRTATSALGAAAREQFVSVVPARFTAGTCLTLDPRNPTVSGTRVYAVNCDSSWPLQQFTRRNRPVSSGLRTSAGLCVQAQNPQSIGTNVPIIQKTCNDSTLDQIAGLRLPPRP